jgi:RND family efflux transporter MFP subunit
MNRFSAAVFPRPLLSPLIASIISLGALLALAVPAQCADKAQDVITVAAARVVRGEISREASFDAELRPFQEIELHARVTGYMDVLNVDAGDIVKAGDVLAVLDVPDLKIEIEHALAAERRSKAEIVRAEAAYEDANLAYERLIKTSEARPNLIAQQDIDTAKAHDRTAEAAVDAAREAANVASAEVKRLRILNDYTRITAPFAGVITKRYNDPGALIQAGTSTGTLPVVRLSQNEKLRVVFPVSISFVSAIKVGDPVEIRIPLLGRTISGTVARFSKKVETSTRTMDTEVDVPNKDLSLIPGIYATAVLRTDHHEKALVVPVEAVSREKETATVYVINREHRIEERQVKLGLETANRIEILSGVSENELVMTSSRAQVKPGEVVEAKVIETATLAVKP